MKTDVNLECGGKRSATPLYESFDSSLLTKAASRFACGRTPKLGFLGVGWIGRNRLEAIAKSGLAEVVAIADTSAQLASKAAESAPEAAIIDSMDELFETEMDGVVIATPSALHAAQATAALEHGLAVFCQKPLGRNGRETKQVIDAARKANRLLGVDLSYRFITCIREIHDLCAEGALGEIYAADLTFHNAYGPDKPWFYDRELSGGGCVLDLGIHLLDLALWNLGFRRITNCSSRLFAQGKPVGGDAKVVEDYAVASLDLESGANVRLACSWKLPAGCDAIINGAFYGTRGGAAFHNVNGSFYEFVAERFQGTQRELLHSPQEDWGGRAAVNWARRLAKDGSFDPEIESLGEVADALDGIYQNA